MIPESSKRWQPVNGLNKIGSSAINSKLQIYRELLVIKWVLIFAFFFHSMNVFGQNKSESDSNLQKAIIELGSDNYEIRVKAKKTLDEIGLRAIPYLRKIVASEDLEVKDYAVNKLSQVFSYPTEEYKPVKILGDEIKIKTYENFYHEYYGLIKELLLDAYKKTSAKDSPHAENIKDLITIFTDYCIVEEVEGKAIDIYHVGRSHRKNEMNLRKKLKEISAAGCTETVFVLIKHYLYFRWNDNRLSIDELQKKATEIVNAGGSLYFESVILSFVRNFKSRNPAKNEMKTLLANHFKTWVKLGKDEAMKKEVFQKRYVLWFDNFKDTISVEELEKTLPEITENIGKDSWVVLIIKATILHKKAWSIRGGSYASEVKEENWKLFHDNILLAQEAALAAYQLQKESKEVCNLLISIAMANSNGDKIRLWFERAMAIDINNKNGFQNYIWANLPRWGGSIEGMISLGREFLLINQPQSYAAWNYLAMVARLKGELKDVYRYPGLIQDIEWAVEQLVASKSVHSHLYNNELAIATFYQGSYEKCSKAILETKGLFSTSWVNVYDKDGIFIENFVSLYVKYKDKKSMVILKQLQEKTTTLEMKDFFQLLEKEIEPVDRPKMASILIRVLKANVLYLDEKVIDSLCQFGYGEVVLITYYYEYLADSKVELQNKLIEKFGKKAMDSLEIIKNSSGSGAEARKNVIDGIKSIFMAGLNNETELDKIHDYQKAVLRGLILIGNKSNEDQKYRDLFAPYIKKFQNLGDGAEFISSHIYASGQKSVANGLCDVFKNYFFNPNEHQFAWVDEEIKKLSNPADDAKYLEEINLLRKNKGKPVLIYTLIDLLNSKNKQQTAENLKQWLFYCISAYHMTYRDECLVQSLSLAPGYSKEAFQMGLRAARENDCNVMNYLSAYHAFQLGHHHLAYEILCQAQFLKEHGSAVVVNKQRFVKSSELRDFIVESMLKSKDLPEYIRYNLMDQFKN